MTRDSARTAFWPVLLGGAGAGAVGVAAATILVGRAHPAGMTSLHGAVFLLAAAAFAGVGIWAWRREEGVYPLLLATYGMAPGILMIVPVAYLYWSDSFNSLVWSSASLKTTLLAIAPLSLAVGIALTEAWTHVPSRLVEGRWLRVPVADFLVLVVAGIAFDDLLLKMIVGETGTPLLGLTAIGPIAVLVLLFGRATPQDLDRRWWRPHLIPLILPLAFALGSNGDNALRHLLVTSGGAKAQTVLLLAIAVYGGWLLRPGPTPSGVLAIVRQRIARQRIPIVVMSLLGIGLLQAGSYRVVTMDDLARYWIIADNITGGQGYPTWSAGGGIAQAAVGEMWVDSPIFPLMLAASFGVAGHFYHSAQIPIILANVALPALLFVTIRALVGRDDIALVASLLTVLFPPFQIHLLGAAEPDAVFVVELVLAIWILARIARAEDSRWREHAALGVVLLLLALTRPDGPGYAAVFSLSAVAFHRSWKGATAMVTVVVGAMAFAAFVAFTTDALWPPRSSGLTIDNIGANLEFVRTDLYRYYAGTLLLDDLRAPILLLALSGLFLFGILTLARRRSVLLALPVALLVNLLLTLSVDPGGLHRQEPPELFRHLAFGLPIVAVGAAAGFREAQRRLPCTFTWLGPLAALIAAVLIGGEIYVLATPEEWYHGNNSGSLLRGGDIYVQAVEMFQNPIALPCSPCATAEAPGSFAGFRDRLFEHYGRFDMHSNTVGISYAALTAILSAVALAVVMVRPGVAAGLHDRGERPGSSSPVA